MNETDFNHAYPARECPTLPSPPGWTHGYLQARFACEGPMRNCNPLGSDEWRGYEFGVYAAGRDGPGDEMRLTPGAT